MPQLLQGDYMSRFLAPVVLLLAALPALAVPPGLQSSLPKVHAPNHAKPQDPDGPSTDSCVGLCGSDVVYCETSSTHVAGSSKSTCSVNCYYQDPDDPNNLVETTRPYPC